LRRAIQRYLEDPLSEKILLAEFAEGDEIGVDVNAGGEELSLAATSPTKT
jgi:ATP-dependent Clp protease ATP-binding subunit ClpC